MKLIKWNGVIKNRINIWILSLNVRTLNIYEEFIRFFIYRIRAFWSYSKLIVIYVRYHVGGQILFPVRIIDLLFIFIWIQVKESIIEINFFSNLLIDFFFACQFQLESLPDKLFLLLINNYWFNKFLETKEIREWFLPESESMYQYKASDKLWACELP